ncbi:MAG: hypothetical protein V5A77_06450 [Candidatus Bipolaricaulota bacterium]|nr:hypothetical protein [Candidatus Bipolaricaulota bacterium]
MPTILQSSQRISKDPHIEILITVGAAKWSIVNFGGSTREELEKKEKPRIG